MRWWRRHEERVEDADRELEISRERFNEAKEKVVKPLAKLAARNNFAELLRASLVSGHGRNLVNGHKE
jgi:hypothetical protein